jgi:hypothetical protein
MDIDSIKNDDIDRIDNKHEVLKRFCELSQKVSKHLVVEFEPGIYYRPVADCFCYVKHNIVLFEHGCDEHLMKFIEDAVDAKIDLIKAPVTLQEQIDELKREQKHTTLKQSHGCTDTYCAMCDG